MAAAAGDLSRPERSRYNDRVPPSAYAASRRGETSALPSVTRLL